VVLLFSGYTSDKKKKWWLSLMLGFGNMSIDKHLIIVLMLNCVTKCVAL